MTKIVVPDDQTPRELMYLLSVCSNEILTLVGLVPRYRQAAARSEVAVKRAIAAALIRYKREGTVQIVRAMVDSDAAVTKAQDDYINADAVYQVAKGELDAYDAQFTALRKQAEIKKVEMNRGLGQ